MRRFLITEDEKKYILKLYGILKEQWSDDDTSSAPTRDPKISQTYENNAGWWRDGSALTINGSPFYKDYCVAKKFGKFNDLKGSLRGLVGLDVKIECPERDGVTACSNMSGITTYVITDIISPKQISGINELQVSTENFNTGLKRNISEHEVALKIKPKTLKIDFDLYLIYNCCAGGFDNILLLNKGNELKYSNVKMDPMDSDVSKGIMKGYCYQWNNPERSGFVSSKSKPFPPINIATNKKLILDLLNSELDKPMEQGVSGVNYGSKIAQDSERRKRILAGIEYIEKTPESELCSMAISKPGEFESKILGNLGRIPGNNTIYLTGLERAVSKFRFTCPSLACISDFKFVKGFQQNLPDAPPATNYLVKGPYAIATDAKSYDNKINTINAIISNKVLIKRMIGNVSEITDGTWTCDKGSFVVTEK